MQLNNKLIRTFKPCYDPDRYFKDQDNYSMIDLLKDKRIPPKDRLWVCVRHQLMTDLQLKYYGLECAKLSLKYTKDKRVNDCLKVVSKFLKGKATKEELLEAELAAWSAAWSAAESARLAARLTEAEAKSAESAAWSARLAEAAAWSARLAEAAARSARLAEAAARSAAWSATESARPAMEEKQCKILIKILKTVK